MGCGDWAGRMMAWGAGRFVIVDMRLDDDRFAVVRACAKWDKEE